MTRIRARPISGPHRRKARFTARPGCGGWPWPRWGPPSGRSRPRPAPMSKMVLAIDGSGSINAAEFSCSSRDMPRLPAQGRAEGPAGGGGRRCCGCPVGRYRDDASGHALEPAGRPGRAPGSGGQAGADAPPGSGQHRAWPRALGGAGPVRFAGQCGLRGSSMSRVDGYETITPRPRAHVPLAEARKRADAMQVTVNALAIESDIADLAEWYHDRLLSAPGPLSCVSTGSTPSPRPSHAS